MKQFSGSLQTHLDSGTTTLAWCWRLTRSDGVIFGFTDHDLSLTFDGTTFEPESGFTASEIRSGSDLSVDAQEAEGVLTSNTITETDILDGRWDNATVEIWRVNWADTASRALLRRGAIGQLRRGRLHFVAEMRSLAHVLGQTIGRTFQASCDTALGDARCGMGLDNPAFKATGTVVSISGDRGFTVSGLSGFAESWFALGALQWLTGANTGRKAEVLSHGITGADVIVTLLEAPVRTVEVGNTFDIFAGCNKRFETCQSKFANAVNFRGFPHIPGQDTVIRYAAKGDANAGAVL
ncbi:beta tubulin [Rhodobacterales bacterium 52_120_T64]|nr:beta tubulin [Rhodobacterales bacterium 52_120_T64]